MIPAGYRRKVMASLLLFATASCFAKTSLTYRITGFENKKAIQNAIDRLEINEKSAGKLTPALIQKLYLTGGGESVSAFEPYGYFHAKVTHQNLEHTGKAWVAHYKISPGIQTKITSVVVKVLGPGKGDKRIVSHLSNFHLKRGQVFNVTRYKKSRNTLLLVAQKRGYIQAKYTLDQVTVNLPKRTCKVAFTLETGPRFYFGPTHFSRSPLSDVFLKRYLTYKQGKPFSSNKLSRLQDDLGGAGYFESVSVLPELKKIKGNQVPVQVDLTKAKRQRYQIGLGFGTVSGPRVTGGVKWRWMNAYGHHFNTNFTFSQIDRNLEAQYVIPGSNPAKNNYFINAGIYTLRPRHGRSEMEKVGFGYTTNYRRWQLSTSLSRMWERYRITKQERYRNARVLLPNFTATYLTAPDRIKVNRGSRLTMTLQGGDEHLLSTVSFAQFIASYKTIQTFWKDNRIVLYGNYGYTVIKDSNNLPLSLRFYTGGYGSVRGYGLQSMGPGRFLLVGSAEYQRRVWGDIYGAVFYDIGNAFNNYSRAEKNLKRSTGVGVVWLSAVGNVSFYVAKALSQRGQPIRLMINLGADL
jgi:translocation and assembly module TamA